MTARPLLVVAAVAVACDAPVAPTRTAAYAFDAGGDVFNWPTDRLPVRYYADPRGAMPTLVRDAMAIWEGQFLYGEFDATTTGDSATADVLVLWAGTVPPDVPPDPGPPVPACTGVTSFTIDAASTIEAPLRVTLSVVGGFSTAQVAACLRRVTVHELGHSLGLLGHSADALDIMAIPVQVGVPSARDRQTVEVLYHTPPTIRPPPRP